MDNLENKYDDVEKDCEALDYLAMIFSSEADVIWRTLCMDVPVDVAVKNQINITNSWLLSHNGGDVEHWNVVESFQKDNHKKTIREYILDTFHESKFLARQQAEVVADKLADSCMGRWPGTTCSVIVTVNEDPYSIPFTRSLRIHEDAEEPLIQVTSSYNASSYTLTLHIKATYQFQRVVL